MEATDERQDNRLETFVAILIALATVVGAVVAWRASVAGDGAGDADFAGLRATVNLEETRAINAVNAYENYGAFVTYQRYNDLGDLIVDDQGAAGEEEAALLEEKRTDAYELALANQALFPNQFRNRDGSYALQRQLGEMFADAAKEQDLQPDPQYAEADKLRDKTNQLLLAVTILAVALVFYTLVEAAGNQFRYVLVGLGTLCTIAGAVFAVFIEFQA